MRRSRAKTLNVCLLIVFIALAASLWRADGQGAEPPTPIGSREALLPGARIAGRFYFGNRFNGALLEMRGDRFVEYYKKSTDVQSAVVSSGRSYQSGESLVLVDDRTGTERRFNCGPDTLCLTGHSFATYSRTEMAWGELLMSGASRYSVDGIRIGMTEEEVNAVEVVGGDDFEARRVRYDQFGRVCQVSGHRLYEGNELILSSEDNFERAARLGEKHEFKVVCGSGMRGLRGVTRDLPEHYVRVHGLVESELRKNDPEGYELAKAHGVNFDKIYVLELRVE